MLIVREKTLPAFIPVAFLYPAHGPDMPCGGFRPSLVPAPAAIAAREVYVPREPVRLPAAHRLSNAEALAQARAGVTAALDELRDAEAALERQLADMQAFLDARLSRTPPADRALPIACAA